MLATLDWIGSFLQLAFGFGLVILVHELGHFLVAKWVGVKVEQFAIGFGTAAISYRKGLGVRAGSTEREYQARIAAGEPESKFSETEYRLNWFPLGGYVKMLGQDDMDPAAASDDPRSFTQKPVWARMAVISAGVIMNLIFAIVLFVICFMVGVEMLAPVVGSVKPGSSAATVLPSNAPDIDRPGLRPGDEILSVNGEPVRSFQDVQMAAAMARAGRSAQLTVQRDGQVLEFDLTPKPGDMKLLEFGIGASMNNRVVSVAPTSVDEFRTQLDAAGLDEIEIEPGMTLARVNSEPIEAYWQLQQIVNESNGRPVSLEFVSETGESVEAAVKPLPESMVGWTTKGEDTWEVAHVLGLTPTQLIVRVEDGSGAADAGLLEGDVIARVENLAWPRHDELMPTLETLKGEKASVTVWRDGEFVDTEVGVSRQGRLGIAVFPNWSQPILAAPLDRSLSEPIAASGESSASGADRWIDLPAGELDLLAGTRIVALDGDSVDDWTDLQRLLRDRLRGAEGGATVSLRVALPLPDRPEADLDWTIGESHARRLLETGWQLPLHSGYFRPLKRTIKAESPAEALRFGYEETKRVLVMTYLTIDRLFRGTVRIEHLKGPVGIAQIGTQLARDEGFFYLLMFLGIINVNLAVINFLPIPVLDGGWFVLLVIEKIKGSPVSERARNLATTVGFFMIATLILVTFYNDVATLVRSVLGT
ncbi:MAG: site-2 protease family protein [Phycisphaerales bacterium]